VDAVNAFGIAVGAVDARMRVVFANRGFRACTVPRDGIGIAHDRLVSFPGRVSEMVERAITGACAGKACRVVVNVETGDCGAPLPVHVGPLTSTGVAAGARQLAEVMFRPAIVCDRALPDDLVRVFGLTIAEARVALAVTAGMPPKRVAARLGVSLHTVRTQVQCAFQKIGVRRQIDLARVIQNLPSLR
jgi:DNA-binding CsgD family transcriptional regulator